MTSFEAFVDELAKIAVELTPQERGVQALQFGGLGAIATPMISALTNKIESGTFLPPGVSKGRWLGARMVGGALTAGALPVVRHHIERSNLQAARTRQRAERV